eukprot:NODE_4438_length_787_cov_38.150000_g4279_i0.p1 GENE.NODE_4438_length_787_cov_38.150000_g4279_i0~~NODE_4438_length_787_cov_38.150000_g4279_i0.p1  ORF type:complete len:213 (-),score=57.54 NODE_4438_length_787_cov_38.150000_g4279_i0:88-726(-)
MAPKKVQPGKAAPKPSKPAKSAPKAASKPASKPAKTAPKKAAKAAAKGAAKPSKKPTQTKKPKNARPQPRMIMSNRDREKREGKLMRAKKTKIRTSVMFHRPYTQRLPGKRRFVRKCGGTASKEGKMDQFTCLKFPLTTESAMKKIEENNTLVFIVDIRANKRTIKAAVRSMYDIKAKKVNTLIRPDGLKKAYIRLMPEYDALDVANKIGIL